MILQTLNDYYLRKMNDPDPAKRLPVFGFEDKEIPFILELAVDGRLMGIKDTRTVEGKKKIATRYLVPKGVKKTSGIASNLLWDNAEYVLGLPDKKKQAEADKKGKEQEYLARLVDMQAAFKQQITTLPEAAQNDEGIRAVLAFLDADPLAAVAPYAQTIEITESNPILSFRLVSDDDLVCQRPAVSSAAASLDTDEALPDADAKPQMCLVTGQVAVPERLHTSIKGVWGAQTSGANIVSFNLDAFRSFGKDQGANAPVSPAAAFAYTTALNHLLQRGSRQRMQVGDTSTVFWAQKAEDAEVESWLVDIFGESDNPDAHTEQVLALFEAIRTGQFAGSRGENKFYVLGLAPNAARISVRFWQPITLAELAQRTQQWFDDLKIVRAPYDPEFPSLKKLLAAVCLATKDRPHGDIERFPNVLIAGVVGAALTGCGLPSGFFNLAVQRCRAEQAKKDEHTGKPVRHVSYLRAAIIRAYINRQFRTQNRKEINVSLDVKNTDKPYLLGRLFATFERMQEVAAERDLNRSIRDSFFGAAMASPRSVFPRLVRLNQHHFRDIKKIRHKTAVYFDCLLGEINNGLDPKTAFPPTFNLKEQGIFAIGYYHQRQDFFPKSETESPTPSTQGVI